uniref:TGF-beta family profile domain-containing protein n=1 Tax=Glossina brevipalpis TaxID=37001 RepID=A0A1A9WQC3_9MUSC
MAISIARTEHYIQVITRITREQCNAMLRFNKQTTTCHYEENSQKILESSYDPLTRFCGSFEVNTSQLGWQKFDMTPTIKEWYTHSRAKKLRLLIDCTGCGKIYTLQLFDTTSSNIDLSQHQQIVNVSGNNMIGRNWSSLIKTENENPNSFHLNTNVKLNVTAGESLKYSYDISSFKSNKFSKYENKNEDNENVVYTKSVDIESDKESLNPNRPFLVLHTETKRQRRIRRRAINCNGALHGQCCKESFYVSFKALGWDDWIIAPRGYFANYCRGDCTGPYRTPDTFQTFHAHFIEEYRKMGLLNGMQPCCAPIKFSSMSLIYYGDEGIIKRDLPKMVVDECGCP